jgi:hypothetical protein
MSAMIKIVLAIAVGVAVCFGGVMIKLFINASQYFDRVTGYLP